jgi:YD repeat-containing protein
MKIKKVHKKLVPFPATVITLITFIPVFAENINYIYDDLNRLTKVVYEDGTFIHTATMRLVIDCKGVMKITTSGDIGYTYNAQENRLVSAEAESSGYDEEGQLNTGYGSSCAFDYEHRLKTVGGDIRYYCYGWGRRLRAVRSGIETCYIYDAAGTLLAEADQDNNINRYYLYDNGLLAMVTPEVPSTVTVIMLSQHSGDNRHGHEITKNS